MAKKKDLVAGDANAPRRVRALKPGFYHKLRDVGEVFLLAPGVPFSEKWMEDVTEETPLSPVAAPTKQSTPRLKPNAADLLDEPPAPAGTGDSDPLGGDQ